MRKKKKKEPETVKQANWLCWIQAICYKLFSSFGFCYSVIECFLFVFSCFLPLLVKKKDRKFTGFEDACVFLFVFKGRRWGGYGGQFVNYGQQSSEAGSGFLSPRRDSLRLSTGCGHCVFWAVHPAYFVFFNSIFVFNFNFLNSIKKAWKFDSSFLSSEK